MPSGALGIWYADQWDSAANAIPNAALATSPKANWLRAPRGLFSQGYYWSKSGCTATDAAATAPDGTAEASTVVGAADWYITPGSSFTLPAGTYTVACSVRSNTGANQQFKIGDFQSSQSSTQTATPAWQRFSWTFTTGGNPWPTLVSFDRATGASLQICDFEMYTGSADLGPIGADGHMYLGTKKNSTTPVVTANVLDLSQGSGAGLIQLPALATLSAFTVMAMAYKTGVGQSFNAILTKFQDFTQFAFMQDETGPQMRQYFGDGNFFRQSALWDLTSQGWHLITVSYDGTYVSLWIDDAQVLARPVTVSAQQVRDFAVGLVNASSGQPSIKLNSLALYPSALTPAQIGTSAYGALAAKAKADGLTLGSARLLVAEGDSITAASPTYVFDYSPNATVPLVGGVYAASGAVIGSPGDSWSANSLYGRAAQVDRGAPANKGSRKFILSVLIGANDLVSISAATYLANLAAYLDARRAAGWIVVLCTVLPRSDTAAVSSGFLTKRATVNPELRLWTTNGSIVPGKHADYIVDFAADATMGVDGASDNATYYNTDKLHPTPAGQALLEPIYRAVVNAI